MSEAVDLEEDAKLFVEEKLEFQEDIEEIEGRIKALKEDNLGLSASEVAEELKTLKLAHKQLGTAQTKAEIAKMKSKFTQRYQVFDNNIDLFEQIKKFVTKQLNKRIEAWKKKRKEKLHPDKNEHTLSTED